MGLEIEIYIEIKTGTERERGIETWTDGGRLIRDEQG